MITAKQIYPQTCDMGSDYKVYEFTERTNLMTVINWIKENFDSWGTIDIKFHDGDNFRKFDYDLYNKHEFYINLGGWERFLEVKEMSSHSCFMCCDIEIKLGRDSIYKE